MSLRTSPSVDLSGLSAFTLSPVSHLSARQQSTNLDAVSRLVGHAVDGGADSLGVLGSTGSYAYFDEGERAAIAKAAVASSGDVPVIVGVGAVGTAQLVRHALNAAEAGAAALLVPVMTYQQLSDEEALSVFEAVSEAVELPIVVYDNPGTTHFTFSDELYARVAEVPGVISIKIPPTRLPADLAEAQTSISALKDTLPAGVTLGISGDAAGARGLLAGCETWYSTLAGTVTEPLVDITRAAQQGASGDADQATAAQAGIDRMQPIWDLFGQFGSMRVTATIAEILGLAPADSVPAPVQTLTGTDLEELRTALSQLGLAD